MVRIVFVCTGNICRSPIAEAVLRHQWQVLGKGDLIVSSMGTHGLDHEEPSEYAIQVCNSHGLDITSHRSRPLVFAELESAQLILSMEKIHKEFLYIFFPQVASKNFLLGAWPAPETRKSNIKDPFKGTMKVYEEVYDIIANNITRIIPFIGSYFFNKQ